jgi:hypothetical protein
MRRRRAEILGRQSSVSGPARSREALLAAGPSATCCADTAELEEGHAATQVRGYNAAVSRPHDALQRSNFPSSSAIHDLYQIISLLYHAWHAVLGLD